ncbi:unnamed protein product, partial [Mesorhabditis spiculigera]
MKGHRELAPFETIGSYDKNNVFAIARHFERIREEVDKAEVEAIKTLDNSASCIETRTEHVSTAWRIRHQLIKISLEVLVWNCKGSELDTKNEDWLALTEGAKAERVQAPDDGLLSTLIPYTISKDNRLLLGHFIDAYGATWTGKTTMTCARLAVCFHQLLRHYIWHPGDKHRIQTGETQRLGRITGGLGREEEGKRFPIRTVLKRDRCGLGTGRDKPRVILFRPHDIRAVANVKERKAEKLMTRMGDYGCRVCNERYDAEDEKRIPRVLTGCGHTICQGCSEAITQPGSRSITCPFDRIPTTLPDGTIMTLKKNFALIELMERVTYEEHRADALVSSAFDDYAKAYANYDTAFEQLTGFASNFICDRNRLSNFIRDSDASLKAGEHPDLTADDLIECAEKFYQKTVEVVTKARAYHAQEELSDALLRDEFHDDEGSQAKNDGSLLEVDYRSDERSTSEEKIDESFDELVKEEEQGEENEDLRSSSSEEDIPEPADRAPGRPHVREVWTSKPDRR